VKLRILGDTIRLRLDRAEVDQVGAGNVVSAATTFPDGAVFCYRLEPGMAATEAVFSDGCISLKVLAETLTAWATDDHQVGVYQDLALPEGTLALRIEKDFECLEPRSGEDQGNRFINPKSMS